MSEMALTADHLVVIGRGHLISTGTVEEFIAQSTSQYVRVRSPRSDELARLLAAEDVQVTNEYDGALSISGISAADIGELAGTSGIYLHELSPQMASLEDAFMELTKDSVEYHGTSGPVEVGPTPYSLSSGK
jgi:ABC-2 type transport system ATP-binding protein